VAATGGTDFVSAVEILTDGSAQIRATVTWQAPATFNTDIQHYEVSIKRSVGGAYVAYMTAGLNYSWVLPPGIAHDVSIVAVDKVGNKSAALTYANKMTTTDTTIPTAPTINVGATVTSPRSAFLRWTNTVATDLNHVQIYEAFVPIGTTAPGSGSAVQIATVNARSGEPGSYTRTGLDITQDYYYWFKSVDTSGNVSAAFSSRLGPLVSSKLANDDFTTGTLNANLLQSASSLPSTLFIGVTGFTLGTHVAARINTEATLIQPGKVTISGATTLADWRSDADVTKIDGGELYVNSVRANAIAIGTRGVNFTGLVFTAVSSTTVSWTAGTATYVNDAGILVTTNIAAGSHTRASGTLVTYFHWHQDAGNIEDTTDYAAATVPSSVHTATFNSGASVTATYGRVYIDGGQVTANSIGTNQLKANSVVASTVAAGAFTGREISATASIMVGTGDNSILISGLDPVWRLAVGNAIPDLAPFRVDKYGKATASNLEMQLLDGTVHWSSEGGHTTAGMNQIITTQGNTLPVTAKKDKTLPWLASVPSGTLADGNFLSVEFAADSDVVLDGAFSLYGEANNNGTTPYPTTLEFKLYERYKAPGGSFGAWSQLGSTKTLTKVIGAQGDTVTSSQYLVYPITTYELQEIGQNEFDYVATTVWVCTTTPNPATFTVSTALKPAGIYEYSILGPGGTGFQSKFVKVTATDDDGIPSILLGSSGTAYNFVHPIGFLSKLKANNTSATNVNVTFDTAIISTAADLPRTIRSFNGNCSMASSGGVYTTIGVGGCSTACAGGGFTFLGLWLISDGLTNGLMFDPSLTAPTLPSGFSYRKLVGAFKATHLGTLTYDFQQNGQEISFLTSARPNVKTGSDGSISSPTLTSVAMRGAVVPSNASSVLIQASGGGNTTMVNATSTSGAYNSLTCPLIVADNQTKTSEWVVLEGDDIYYASNGGTNAFARLLAYRIDI
jgi:hypothetical protein